MYFIYHWRLRAPLFPNCPAYLHFINAEEEYEEDPQPFQAVSLPVRVARDTSQSVLDCFTRLGLTIQPWDLSTNLTTTGGPVWDHVLVCEKGHFIPFNDLHPAVKVNILYHLSSELDLEGERLPLHLRPGPEEQAVDLLHQTAGQDGTASLQLYTRELQPPRTETSTHGKGGMDLASKIKW